MPTYIRLLRPEEGTAIAIINDKLRILQPGEANYRLDPDDTLDFSGLKFEENYMEALSYENPDDLILASFPCTGDIDMLIEKADETNFPVVTFEFFSTEESDAHDKVTLYRLANMSYFSRPAAKTDEEDED